MSIGDRQKPGYLAVLGPLAALALLIVWLVF